jgi:putative nucleotidyltransferase with HDIG domain
VANEEIIEIDSKQLQPGMYVYIDLGWMDHPFPLNRFKIKSEDQLRTIRSLGIQKIRYNPALSDTLPLPFEEEQEVQPAPPKPVVSPEVEAMMAEKKARKERLTLHRKKVVECERKVANAARLMRGINNDIFSKPGECVESAGKLMDDFVETLMEDSGTILFALNDKLAGEEIYVHSVNVSVLAMLLAKELKLSPVDTKLVGMGSLFHDIGKLDIPGKVTMKTDPLTAAEKSLLQEHTNYGVKIARNAKLDANLLAIVAQHHEHIDGSGYPNRLTQDRISPFAQLVAIINLYDNLCNPVNPAHALTPHEALSTMFKQYKGKLNSTMLQVFIRFMGVYPPGSIVSLSNGAIGMVISVSSKSPLKPAVLVYDAGVPKEEAMILDLEALPDVTIDRSIRPNLLSPDIFAYLNPRQRATYFFDASKK